MSRSVEITILSAENLQMNKKSIKKNAFVTLQSDGSSDACSTKVDTEGGSYPSWNEKVVMDVPLHARFITAEVNCRASTGDKSVAMARIPISDILGGYVPQNQVHFLSYRLWDSKVRRNGVINISVRVKVPEMALPPPANGLPVKGVTVAANGSNGVVAGIPINWLQIAN